jgi:hypothetical protein
MERFVTCLNIERFRQKLENETDETKRRMLELLLSEEQARLAALMKSSADKIDIRPVGFGAAVLIQA